MNRLELIVFKLTPGIARQEALNRVAVIGAQAVCERLPCVLIGHDPRNVDEQRRAGVGSQLVDRVERAIDLFGEDDRRGAQPDGEHKRHQYGNRTKIMFLNHEKPQNSKCGDDTPFALYNSAQ